MLETTECKRVDTAALFDFFESKILSLSPSTARNYRIVVNSLRSFLAFHNIYGQGLPDRALEDWAVSLSLQQLSGKTLLHYIDYISSLCTAAAKEELLSPAPALKTIKEKLKALEGMSRRQALTREAFSRLLNVTKTADRQTGETALFTDMLVFSLLNKGMELAEIAYLPKSRLSCFSDDSISVAERHIDSKRKYIFPLGQSSRTPAQMRRHIEQQMASLFSYRNLPIANSSVDETIKGFWAFAALECGATASQTIQALGCRPAGIPQLMLCTAMESEARDADTLSEMTSSLFFSNPKQWYAMRFRPGVKIDDIDRRFALCAEYLERPEIFYPYEEIAKKIGKKLVYCNRPVISDIAFFRARATDIYPMFSQLSDLAWCYRSGDGSPSPYAVIPASSMKRFQEAIGSFTPDYEVGPAGTLASEGDEIVIIAGDFAGMKGQVIKVGKKNDQTGATVYRIVFPGINGIEWKVNIDSRLTRHT